MRRLNRVCGVGGGEERRGGGGGDDSVLACVTATASVQPHNRLHGCLGEQMLFWARS